MIEMQTQKHTLRIAITSLFMALLTFPVTTYAQSTPWVYYTKKEPTEQLTTHIALTGINRNPKKFVSFYCQKLKYARITITLGHVYFPNRTMTIQYQVDDNPIVEVRVQTASKADYFFSIQGKNAVLMATHIAQSRERLSVYDGKDTIDFTVNNAFESIGNAFRACAIPMERID